MKTRLITALGWCGLGLAIWACSPYQGQTASAAAVNAAITINEILAHTDAPDDDAIELYNPTARAIDISGWILADNRQAEPRFPIPPGTVLAPGGYQVFTFAEDAPFRLSEFGETVYLYQPAAGDAPGPLAASATFGISPNGVAFGPLELSTGEVRQVLLQRVTLGSANAPPLVGPLVIDELMVRPTAGRDEYVVLRNASSTVAALCDPASGDLPARLRLNGAHAFTLPCGLQLAPGERLYITEGDPTQLRAQYGIPAAAPVVGPFSGRLSNEGELVEIVWPQPPETDGVVAYYALDQVEYGATAPWPPIESGVSLLRRDAAGYGDDPANWRAANAPLRVWLPWVGR